MSQSRVVRCVVGGLVAGAMLAGPAASEAQSPLEEEWTMPRTPDGRPDLQGVWANNTATPLERPASLGDKATLTDEELARLQARYAELFASGESDAAFADSVFRRRPRRAGRVLFARRGHRQLQPVLAGRPGFRQPDLAGDRSSDRTVAGLHPAGPAADRRPDRACCRQPGVFLDRPAAAGALHHLRDAEPVRRLQQLLPDHPDPRTRRVPARDDPRRPHHPAGRLAACRRCHPAVARRRPRLVGRGHAGRRDDELLGRQRVAGRTVPADRAGPPSGCDSSSASRGSVPIRCSTSSRSTIPAPTRASGRP